VKLHPATLILAWCLLVALLQLQAFDMLLFAAGAVLLCAVAVSRHKFAQLLRRTRWIMLSLLLIYAWSTPGQALYEPFGAFSPSREGLQDGLSQLLRLLAALAALAMLLDRLHRMQLIAGLYTLFAPLQWMGGLRERFAVRLALTLHYAEATMLRGKRGWRETLDGLLEPHGEPTREMELPLYRFGYADALLVCIGLSALWWSL
jgi:energy-coupling factor transport system permease protein